MNRTTPVDLRTKAAETRERAQQHVEAAERQAAQLEAKAAELERVAARRAAAAQYRQQAREASRTLADLRSQRDQMHAQQDSIGQQQRELARTRAEAISRAAELQSEIAQLMQGGADVDLVAQKRSQLDGLVAVASDYESALQPLAGQVEALQREIDGLKYPLERAEAERDRFEELAVDPLEEEAQRLFEERRQKQFATNAALARMARQKSLEASRREQRAREFLELGMVARDDSKPF